MPPASTEYDPRAALQSQGSATSPLDSAIEYLRARGLPLLPLYILAMAPISIIALFLIDAISAQHRSVVPGWCALLLPATLWRWAFLARIQQLVQCDLQARPGLPLRSRLLPILLARLYANVALTWGSLLLAPSFYGLYAGSFATPLLLEHEGPLYPQMRRLLGWIHHSTSRLFRALLNLSILALMLSIAAFVAQRVLLQYILPSLFDVQTDSLSVTLSSIPWLLSLLYLLSLGFDFYWTIASVFLYYDSQSRRTGSDLRARLNLLETVVREAA